MADVEAVELAAPLVRRVLDGLSVHISVSNRCPSTHVCVGKERSIPPMQR
jgi:hypothetical protein